MERDTTVWVGALWHRQCDPFVRVVAKDKKTLLQTLADLAEEEHDFVTDGDPDAEIDIRQVESAEELGSLQLSRRELSDLEEDGYAYLDS